MAMFCEVVYAFEPNPFIFPMLRENCKLNPDLNIKYLPVALSNSNGEAEFDCRFSGTSRFKSLTKKHRGDVENVNTKTLDSILPNINNCNFIKLDVEGAEFQVLEGGQEFIMRNRPCIVMEVFKTKEKMKKLDAWCLKNAYDCSWLSGDDYFLTPLEDLSPSQ